MTSDLESNDLPRFADLEAEYEILRELGRGGTAVVYLARERQLGRRVAIKVIRATYIEDEEAAARLEREARMVASLNHPNIVMLYGTRRLRDRSLALIMQYIPGRTLKSEVMAYGPLPFDRVQQILTDLARALVCAQLQRIIHRDIKPENIYLDHATGIARLSDFGIARPWDSDQGLTLPGAALGTPAYMSPEQIDGGELDGRSDLYSLGLVGFHMLAGHAPWAGETLFNMIYKQKHEDLPALEVLRPGIPAPLRHALEGVMCKHREDRWQSAEEFLAVLSGRIPPLTVGPYRENPFDNADPFPLHQPALDAFRQPRQAIYRPSAARAVPQVESFEAPPPPPSLAMVESVLATEHDYTPPPRSRRAVIAAAVPVVLLSAVALVLLVNSSGGEGAKQGDDGGLAEVQTKASTPTGVTDTRAASASRLSGTGQVGLAGDTLPQPLVVQVENAAGQPLPGVTVNFTVMVGEGSLESRSAVTSEVGLASTRWFLRQPGMHTVSASVAELQQTPITFVARALPRPAARIMAVSPVEPRGAPGTALGAPLIVAVMDDRGAPVPAAQVRFSVRTGEGKITPSTTTTGADGRASAEWVLGQRGVQEVVASLPNVPAARTVFRAGDGAAAVTAAPPVSTLTIRRGISVGGTHTCSLGADGGADCWGGNDKGQLGDGSASRRTGLVRVSAAEQLASVSSGVSHTCSVGVSGTVFCWGANVAGQLGDGTRQDRALPVRVETAEPITRVFTGMSHSCALSASGRLFCWGSNTNGQLGDGTRTDRPTPVAAGAGRTFRTVAVGWSHTCALASDGAAFCWGRNASGELGDGSTTDRTEPSAVAGGTRFSAIAAGSGHSCALTATGSVMCWGQNSFGQLGNETTDPSPVPVTVQPSDFFSAIALGSVHSCALTRDGSARCWGRNTYGQLGDGTLENHLTPTAVVGGHRFNALDASGAHTCGTSGGATFCWGYNSEGQLGNGTRTNQSRPVAVNR